MPDDSLPTGPCVYVVEDDATAAAFALAAAALAGLGGQWFDSAEDALRGMTATDRGCLVLDLSLGGMNGLDLQTALLDADVRLPVIVVSGQGDITSAVRAMKQHAFDFFEKGVSVDRLADAIRRAVAEDALRQSRWQAGEAARTNYATLSPRERQVMASVVEGLSNKQIAARLGLSEKTIEVHRGNVMRKMNVDSVPDLVRAAQACA